MPPSEKVSLTEEDALKLATHKHYKGGLYRVLFQATNSEDQSTWVVYEHLWPHKISKHVRSATEFYGDLPDGRMRFQPTWLSTDPS